MKTITLDDKKKEISDESYEAFKKQFVTKDKAILWKPEEDEEYYLISADGCIDYEGWDGEAFDNGVYELGNCFQTKEEAEEALKTGWIAKRKAEVEILRFIAENDLEWDWETRRSNFCLYYDYDTGAFEATHWAIMQYSILSHFKSEADAQKVIDAMTPQLKILFGV